MKKLIPLFALFSFSFCLFPTKIFAQGPPDPGGDPLQINDSSKAPITLQNPIRFKNKIKLHIPSQTKTNDYLHQADAMKARFSNFSSGKKIKDLQAMRIVNQKLICKVLAVNLILL